MVAESVPALPLHVPLSALPLSESLPAPPLGTYGRFRPKVICDRAYASSLASIVICAFSTFETGHPALALFAAVSKAC